MGAFRRLLVEDERSGGQPGRRGLEAGLLRFFGTTRRDEAAYVNRAQNNLRESIWAFVSGLHQLVVEEHEEDKIVQDHISRVRAAVTSQDTGQLKRETMAAVSAMESLMESRRERQREQFSQLAGQLKDLGRELEDARKESALDGLTRLPNRKAFDDYITRSVELHSLMGRSASLLMVDDDNLKVINDTNGHTVGDDALRQVTRALSRTILRKVDFVCRLGGDEFAVILQETDARDALALGEKLRRSPAGRPRHAKRGRPNARVHNLDRCSRTAPRRRRPGLDQPRRSGPVRSQAPRPRSDRDPLLPRQLSLPENSRRNETRLGR